MRRLFSPARVALLAGLSLVLAACGAAVTPTVPPPTPVPTVPPRADPELLKTALANMSALRSFTWDLTQEYTVGLGGYTYPRRRDLLDRVWGDADAAHQTYRFAVRHVSGFTQTAVARDDKVYAINPDGSATELHEVWLFLQRSVFQQSMWQRPTESFDYTAMLTKGVTVTLGTPPSEVIDGAPTTHLVMDLRALSEVLDGAPRFTETVEFWVDSQPPVRVRQLVRTVAGPSSDEAGPGLPSPTEPGAYFIVNVDMLQLRRLPDGALLRTVQLGLGDVHTTIKIAGVTPDGRSMIGLSLGQFYRWSTRNGQVESESFELTSYEPGYTLSPDGGLLALTEDGIGLYRTTDWQRVASLQSALPGTALLTFSPDGRLVAGLAPPVADAGDSSPRRVLQMWRTDGTLLRTQTLENLPEGEITALFITPDGRQLVTHAREAGVVQVWQVADGTLLHTLQPAVPGPARATLSPDGRWLALTVGLGSDLVYVWDLQHPTAEVLRLEQAAGGGAPGDAPHFSADGRWLLVSGAGVRVWAVPDFAPAPVPWLQQVETARYVWQWGHFNEPVSIPPLRLAPTATP